MQKVSINRKLVGPNNLTNKEKLKDYNHSSKLGPIFAKHPDKASILTADISKWIYINRIVRYSI